ncbi:CBS domain-containing protein [Beggiatoa alba]|nr:CBS domain-containing protein [Beggiatoa alba]
MTPVGKLLKTKGSAIWSVQPDDTVFDAIELMDDKGIGALAVLLDGDLIGIISERDCARRVILQRLSAEETKVKEIMTSHVYYTYPEQKVDECMAVMTERHIRHLPVMENKRLLGMISLGDLVKDIIEEQKDQIDNLEHTISWGESY